MIHPTATVDEDCTVGETTNVWGHAVIMRGSVVGEGCTIGQKVHIEGAVVGDRCKIQVGAYLPPGTVVGDEVFIGPSVVFTNHKEPTALHKNFVPESTEVKRGANIGANATIGPGITIGKGAFIQMGSRVWKDVPAGATVYGAAPGKED